MFRASNIKYAFVALLVGTVLSNWASLTVDPHFRQVETIQTIECNGVTIQVYDLPHEYHPTELCKAILSE